MRIKLSKTGFTLVETMLAVSLLCVAVTAPMLLTTQALSSAYYARDEVTAYYLAQEGIEGVHSIRDSRILSIALNNDTSADLFGPLNSFAGGTAFYIDLTDISGGTPGVHQCPSGGCPALTTNGTLYGYTSGSTWTTTNFVRTMYVCYMQTDATCSAAPSNQVRVTATVTWKTASYDQRSFTLSENLYRWVQDGSGA